MIALILAELANWNREFGRRTLTIIICCSTLIGLFTTFHPELYFWGMAFIFGWVGLVTGERSGANIQIQLQTQNVKLTRPQILSGDIVAVLIIGLFHVLALLPVAIMFHLIWGISGMMITRAGLVWLMISLVAAIFRIVINRFVTR